MQDYQPNQDVDDVTTFVVMKKLVAKTIYTDAYKLGLVDRNGFIIREPETEIEKQALTSLDRLVFQIKTIIGGRINRFSRFQYLNQLPDTPKKYLVSRGSAASMASVVRVKTDIENGLIK